MYVYINIYVGVYIHLIYVKSHSLLSLVSCFTCSRLHVIKIAAHGVNLLTVCSHTIIYLPILQLIYLDYCGQRFHDSPALGRLL